MSKFAVNILFASEMDVEVKQALISKFNAERENQVKQLVVTDGKKCHYLLKAKLLALYRDVLSNHHGGFCCLNCSNLFRTEINTNHTKIFIKNINNLKSECSIMKITY